MVALSLSFTVVGVDLRAGHDDRDGNVELAVVKPEVERLQVDGDVGGGHVAAHLLAQRDLAVFALRVLEVGGRVVARAVLELRLGMVQQVDGEVAEAAVAPRVGGVEADDVVGLGIVLHLLEGGAEVVGVGEELAAGIAGERAERLLRAEVGVELALHRRAAVGSGAAAGCPATRRRRVERLQAARVDGVEGGVRLDALVGGGADAGLVLNALAREAAREVEHALLLLHLFHRFADGADRVELAVGVERVELAVVRGEAGGVFGGAVGSRRLRARA